MLVQAHGNQLTSLPAEIGQLAQLERLDVRNST
jgi:Leucine-rich repeat (LRR) protein